MNVYILDCLGTDYWLMSENQVVVTQIMDKDPGTVIIDCIDCRFHGLLGL